MVRMFRKPLVIMTPKSLLRNKDATSPLSGVHQGRVQDRDSATERRHRRRQGQARGRLLGQGVLRPGAKRAEKKSTDVAILRVEQLYPFPHKAFAAEMKKYPNATDIVWCQDEPQNQGAWFFIQHQIHENMLDGQKLGYAGRPASVLAGRGLCPPAPGAAKALLDQAFTKLKGFVLTK